LLPALAWFPAESAKSVRARYSVTACFDEEHSSRSGFEQRVHAGECHTGFWLLLGFLQHWPTICDVVVWERLEDV
jgi:hypothetical protein